MKGVFSAPGDYIYFKSQVPLHKISIGSKQWRYYDFGPKVVPPLICLPGTAGTADVFYKQIMSLAIKGYRVISVDIPRVWDHHEWIQAFEKFLDALDVHHDSFVDRSKILAGVCCPPPSVVVLLELAIHLYGTSLGGFLAQLFAQHRPRRVRSLVLSNTFLETTSFSTAMPWAPIVGWTPSFLLKRHVLTGIHDGPHEPFVADSVDFVVAQVETLSRDDLASRLSLTADASSVGPLMLSDSLITIMDCDPFLKTNDFCAIPQQLKDQLTERYTGARQAYLKTGGDFPFLSRPDEVNLHLQLHLRRVGVEPQLPSAPMGDPGGSSSDQNDRNRGDDDDTPEDDRRDYSGPSGPTNTSEPPLVPEGPDSATLSFACIIV
ncbi:hypothetical protein OROGR_026737 [Orobanche gracilis]